MTPADQSSPKDRERSLDVWLGLTGKAPLPEGPLLLPILSGSMRPVIPLGSHILIKPCGAADCRVGDVAVFLEGDKLVAHRILWFWGNRTSGRFFAKGDANSHGKVSRCHRIKGRVKEVHLPDSHSDDLTEVPINLDPFSPEAARLSQQQQIRNILLALPRFIRDRLARR